MKLVLLPGMDGTGRLFEPFLQHYTGEASVIALPECAEQDYKSCYQSVAKAVAAKLPEGDLIVLAESFSGGLLPFLLQIPSHRIKAVIFVAGFLSPPRPTLLRLAQHLPLRFLVNFPGAKIFHKLFFLGRSASPELLRLFVSVVNSVPEDILKRRLTCMGELQLPEDSLDLPVAYLQAVDDVLIKPEKWQEIGQVFNRAELFRIKGPHFILQASPREAAVVVEELVARYTKQ